MVNAAPCYILPGNSLKPKDSHLELAEIVPNFFPDGIVPAPNNTKQSLSDLGIDASRVTVHRKQICSREHISPKRKMKNDGTVIFAAGATRFPNLSARFVI